MPGCGWVLKKTRATTEVGKEKDIPWLHTTLHEYPQMFSRKWLVIIALHTYVHAALL